MTKDKFKNMMARTRAKLTESSSKMQIEFSDNMNDYAANEAEFFQDIGIMPDAIRSISGEMSIDSGALQAELMEFGGTTIEVLWRTYEDGAVEVEAIVQMPWHSGTLSWFAEPASDDVDAKPSFKNGFRQAYKLVELEQKLNEYKAKLSIK